MTSNTQEYWKVVKKHHLGHYISMAELPSDIICTYEIGKTTKPKVGKLFVFTEYDSAATYLNHCRYYRTDAQLLKVTVDPTDIQKVLFVLTPHSFRCMNEYWNVIMKNGSHNMSIEMGAPPNSVVVNSVTPIELIEVPPVKYDY